MVFFLLALLALSPAVAAQPCAAESASFDAAQRAYNQTVPERREDLLQAAQALYGCPGASAARRSDAMAWAVHTLGHARRHEEQLALLDAFFADPSLHTNPRRIVWAHGSRRDALFQLGRPLEVLASLHTVLSEADTLAANVRAGLILELAQTYQALGHREQRRQRIAEALSLLDPERDAYLYSQALERQAWTMATDAIRESPRDVASLHLAETYARRAIDVAARVPEEPQRLYALWNAHSARSEVLHRLGAYEASLQAALQAQDIARRVDPVTLPGQVLKNLGTALVRNGRSSEGLAVFEEMLRIAEEHRPRDVSRAHYMIGWAHAEAGRDRAAERHFRLSVVATERARLETGLSAWGAQAFTQSIGHYNEITALLLRAGRAGEAFEVADASRARMLRDLRRYGRLQERSAEEREAHDALRNDLDATYAAVRAGAPSDAAALMAQASRLEADLAELTGHVPTLQAPPLAEIQQRLAREGRFLVSYFLGRADAGHLPPVAFVVSGSSFHAVSLPVSQDTLSVWVRQALSLLADPRVGRTPPAAPLQRLYDALFHPVAHLVPEGAPLTIVPDGLLHALPFGALLSGPAEPFQYHAWPYLVRRNPLSTVLSAALLVEPSAPPARRPLVAFGRSRFAGASPTSRPSWRRCAATSPAAPSPSTRRPRRKRSGPCSRRPTSSTSPHTRTSPPRSPCSAPCSSTARAARARCTSTSSSAAR